MMIVEPTPILGLLVLQPNIFSDPRGWFLESFNARAFAEAVGDTVEFVQDNESCSSAHVVRGLHFQLDPHTQGKLVRVVRGAVLDVCVDIRKGSKTFGEHYSVRLDGVDKKMLWIPAGFAHGFHALEEGTVFNYKCTAYYEKSADRTLLWNDPALGIDWGIADPVLSDRDKKGVLLADLLPSLIAG
ncbi:MAG: dTDP-4-dehydrorhamnose 3,5-epimerase [Flavobacteriales bacterium]|nr:dTDP-4-dehydrorhamnose 3,5-epimerase [Flavobacteriales bacterium]